MGEIEIICQKFFPKRNGFTIQPITSGHINKTYKILFDDGESFILQKLNNTIFRDPSTVMNNIQQIANHLNKNNYPLNILQPITSDNGFFEIDTSGNYWRAFPFFENTSAFDKVSNPKQAYEAAVAFGLFIKFLDGIDLKSIKETIQNFHNLDFRMQICERVIEKDPYNRIENAKEEIKIILEWRSLLKFDFKKMHLRIVHNDTKISNVLLDKVSLKGICVIDLDTVMKGYLVTDFGDMVRTMCCTASEEEIDLNRVC